MFIIIIANKEKVQQMTSELKMGLPGWEVPLLRSVMRSGNQVLMNMWGRCTVSALMVIYLAICIAWTIAFCMCIRCLKN